MKIVVGLGNPGKKYQQTRHNVGFDVLTEVARRHCQDKPKQRFQGEVAEANIDSEKTLLVWPHTFMNRSGSSVREVLSFFKLNHEDLLVVCDDLNLPLGKLRFRPHGSAGGQKGLANIIHTNWVKQGLNQGCELESDSRPVAGTPPILYLANSVRRKKTEIDVAVMQAADGVRDWVAEGTPFCMNRYNGSQC